MYHTSQRCTFCFATSAANRCTASDKIDSQFVSPRRTPNKLTKTPVAPAGAQDRVLSKHPGKNNDRWNTNTQDHQQWSVRRLTLTVQETGCTVHSCARCPRTQREGCACILQNRSPRITTKNLSHHGYDPTNCLRGHLNDDADAPQGRVGEFGRPTFAGQQKLLNKGLQHAHSAILPDMY